MKISGISMVRNGVLLDYPFTEAIVSALPLVDEFIMVIGDSDDGTREKVESIGSEKIRIIDTVWDPAKRENGTVLAEQTNIGIENATGDWCIYLQADEIIHEKDVAKFRVIMQKYQGNSSVEAILLDYYHFWGYDHICMSKRTYRREIRIIKRLPGIFSYRDAQGFRIKTAADPAGRKLKTAYVKGPHIYAYSRVRSPEEELKKVKHIARYWHNDQWIEEKYRHVKQWDYGNIDVLKPFDQKDHPQVMKKRAAEAGWKVKAEKPKFKSFKYRLAHYVETLTGWRIGEYRNYKIITRDSV